MGAGNDGGTLWAGFCLGALFGAAVALLWTPRSGGDARQLVLHRSSQLKGQLGERATGLQERGRLVIQAHQPVDAENREDAFGKGAAGSADAHTA